MTAQNEFRRLMAWRRRLDRTNTDRVWINRAARKLVLIMRGVPASEWPNV